MLQFLIIIFLLHSEVQNKAQSTSKQFWKLSRFMDNIEFCDFEILFIFGFVNAEKQKNYIGLLKSIAAIFNRLKFSP